MPDDSTLSSALTQLDSIANAAMTRGQREVRAAGVLPSAGAVLGDIIDAMSRPDLAWSAGKAQGYGVSVDMWLLAVQIAMRPPCLELGDLLDRIHQAESAVQMLKAGYTHMVDEQGKVSWARG